MNYKLNTTPEAEKKSGAFFGLARLLPFVPGEGRNGVISLIGILLNSLSSLAGPIIIAYAIDDSVHVVAND